MIVFRYRNGDFNTLHFAVQILSAAIAGNFHFALFKTYSVDFGLKSCDLGLLLLVPLIKLVFSVNVIVNKLLQLDVAVMVAIAFSKNLIHDFRAVTNVNILHFEEIKHLWLVDFTVSVYIDLPEVLLQLDFL